MTLLAESGQLLGREAELAALATALDADLSVAVLGEAGVGKTSLVRAGTRLSGRELLEGGGFATLAWRPYLALERAIEAPVLGDAAQAAMLVERHVGPRVLFIDDLQWVDEASREILERLAGRIQMVVAIRAGDPEAGPAEELAGRLASVSFALDGLGDVDAAALVRRVAPDLSPTLVGRTVRRAGGNPLLLEEMARSRETVGVLGRGLADRRARLSPLGRLDLDLLAVADRPMAMAGLQAVDELLAAGLVRAGGGDVEIRHSLLAEAIRDGLSDLERRSRHARLATLATTDLERAAHLLEAGRLHEAAEVARSGLASTVGPHERASLLATLARATGAPEDVAGAATALYGVFDFAGVLDLVPDDMPRSGEAGQRAAYERARALRRIGRPDEALALARTVLDEARPGSHVSARLVVLVTTLTVNQLGDHHAALALLAARSHEHAVGSPEHTLLDALTELIRMHLGETPDLGPMRRAVENDAADSQADFVSRALDLTKMIVAVSGAVPALEFALETVRRCREAGFPALSYDVLVQAVQSATFAGRFREAAEIADELLEQPVSPRARLYGLLFGLEAHAYMGRYELAAARLEEARQSSAAERGEVAEVDIVALGVAFWSGRLDRASALVDHLLGNAMGSDLNLAVPRKYGAWIDLDLGRPVQAVAPLKVRVLAGLPHEVAGVRALAEGRHEVARVEFDRAAELYRGFLEPDAMLCRWGAAEAARREGHVTALDRLRAIEAEAMDTGFKALLPRVRRSLRLAGIRASANRSNPRGPGLTGREAELVALVERGLSNAEIARRLGLGRPTVVRMLASAMGKLGVDSRAQLAARELV
ncbi:MAG TPA: AAA family ATPase [Candidatus Limnocylindrales bacterium]|nr:AAA family ATPase [Candidatus Limnocylindrales bacterium]